MSKNDLTPRQADSLGPPPSRGYQVCALSSRPLRQRHRQVDQRFSRCSLIARPRAPQPEQTGFSARSTTVTIIASDPNATSLTQAPGSPSIRFNAVLTRTSPSS